MAWLSGWAFRKKITISGSPGAGTGYVVLFLVGEGSETLYAQFGLDRLSAKFPTGKNDGGDLRFTASDGKTLLPFWVETVWGAQGQRVAFVWVRVLADLGTNQSIYVYWGNPDATNGSNAEHTFLFFDDFDGSSLDTTKWRLERWTGSGTYSATVSGGSVTVTAGSGTVAGIVSKTGFSFPFAVEAVFRVSTRNGWHGIVQNPDGSDADWVKHGYSGNYYYYQKNTSGTVHTYQSIARTLPTGWTRMRIGWGPTYSRYFEGTTLFVLNQVNSTLTQDRWSTGTNYVQLFLSSGSCVYDYIFVRKYVHPEPAFASAGSIEVPGWPNGYLYRRKITISGSPDAGTEYQVLLKVGESAGSSGCDFHLDRKLFLIPTKGFSGDMLFTAADGETPIPFWVEKLEGDWPNRIAYVWVKVPANLDTDQDIYCYFGRPLAPNVCNGEQTFLFFDDFLGTSLDSTKWLLGRWAGSGSYTATVSSGYVRISTGSGTTGGIVSRRGFSFPFAVRGLYRRNSGASYHAIVQSSSGSDSDWVRHGYSASTYFYQKKTSGTVSTYESFSRTAPSSFTEIEIIWTATSSRYFESGSQVNTITTQDRWSTGTNYVQLFTVGSSSADYDYVFVRKYVSPEPAFKSAGEIESPPPEPPSPSSRRLLLMAL
jgi:hypothetical protein